MEEQKRLAIIEKHIKNGVVFRGTDSVYVDEEVIIGKGTVIYPDQHIRGKTKIGNNCVLDAGNIIADSTIGNGVIILKSVLKNAYIDDKTTVGPFANIHTNSEIGKECRIGNFVEVKNATLGQRVKAAHLAYVGDVDIGNLCNVGCGSIFVNYDGKNKHRSTVGESVFIGSNSNIIAPVNVMDNAYIAAGTTVTVDLPKNCLCIGRSRETVKENRTKYVKNDFAKKYFGTDGIRGVYGKDLTDETAYLVGIFLCYSADGGRGVVGRDTRVSGDSLVKALIKGITDAGSDAEDMFIVPTPAVSYATLSSNANYGVMISASHNPSEYNGIKIFTKNGCKLNDIEEVEIEKHIDNAKIIKAQTSGRILNGEELFKKYVDEVLNASLRLDGMNIVVDTANGALSGIAKKVFSALGAKVTSYNDEACGKIINRNSGATCPGFIVDKVKETRADAGFSYDGDADRLIAVDENGRIVDGDEIIYIFAKELLKEGKLRKQKVVCTVLSNMGVEKALNELGVGMIRVDVGDHNVQAEMMKGGYVLGGEQSGHIIMGTRSMTCDGLLASVLIASLMKKTGMKLSELSQVERYPQINAAFTVVDKKAVAADKDLADYVSAVRAELKEGRILLRPSGTEEKIRLTVEAKNEEAMKKACKKLTEYIQSRFA